METFGEVISELRKERGLTQKALAAQVKKKDGIAIGIAYINDIEHDRRNPPSPDFVAQLAGGVASTTGGSTVLRRTAPVGRETGRSVTSANSGRLPRLSERDRQKAEVTMKERTAAKVLESQTNSKLTTRCNRASQKEGNGRRIRWLISPSRFRRPRFAN
jgi:transcriptional regulator with XRE-family HTH domain